LAAVLLARSKVSLANGDAEGAIRDTKQAVQIRTELVPQGWMSGHIGITSIALGEALYASGELAAARAALEAGLDHVLPTFGESRPEVGRARELLQDLR
jgi:hypothetical protein